MKWIICYAICPLVGGVIIWWKQGKYLNNVQPLAFLICGPLTLAMAIFLPKSYFTTREQAEGDGAKGK